MILKNIQNFRGKQQLIYSSYLPFLALLGLHGISGRHPGPAPCGPVCRTPAHGAPGSARSASPCPNSRGASCQTPPEITPKCRYNLH